MRVVRMLVAVLVVVLASLLPARAQEGSKFQPASLTCDVRESKRERCHVLRVSFSSRTEAEVTFVRGALPVKGTWSLAASRLIRFVAPDRSVHLFFCDEKGASYFDAWKFVWDRSPPWLTGAKDPPAEGSGIEMLTPDARPQRAVMLLRGAGGTTDLIGPGEQAVEVKVEAKGDRAWLVTFPDGNREEFPRGLSLQDQVVDQKKLLACRNNLSQLAALWVLEMTERPGAKPRYDGAAMLLAWRKGAGFIRPGQENILCCPGDPHLAADRDSPQWRARYDTVDLARIPDDLCSYAVRDFSSYPEPRGGFAGGEPLMCCRQGRDGRTPHHGDTICVAFSDGTTRAMTRRELGLEPGDPIVVGPDSKSPLLRKMIFARKRKE